MQEIYEFITANGKLSEKHSNDLKSKRGFSEGVIKANRFFSGGQYWLEFEEQLLKNFDTQKLISSGVFTLADGAEKPSICTQLLDDRIIIPYLNQENLSYFIRPHKMGLKAGIQIYHEKSMSFDDKPQLIIAESEFKALAAMQFGFKAIGLPGVGSFAGEHFRRLMEFLAKSKIKAVCIIFDNEVKDNPDFPNYKDKPINRYDTEYFSFIMCKAMFDQGIDARIGRLPDSWRFNGKIDIDGALAAGKTVDDFKFVIQTSKPHKQFFDDLSKEAKDIVFKKLQKKYHRSNVHISFNRYIATRYAGKKEYDEEISNFIIKILATHQTSEGMIREAVLIDSAGKHSSAFSLDREMMTDNGKFKSVCMGMGNFVWKGRADDMAFIWEEQFFDDDGRIIVEPDHVGSVSREKIFLSSNIAMSMDDGTEFRPDGDGIFWIGDRGYKPMAIVTTTGKSEVSEGIPYLHVNPLDKEELLKRLSETIGRYEAMICLGWISGFAFMDEIFKLYGCYPFLFVTGKRGSGKSTVAEWVVRLSGSDGCARMLSDTTTVAIQRLLGYYSCMPVLLDEFRNSKIILPKMGMMRNVYNRQSAGKGTKESFGIREGKIRGGLMIAGEETPEDNALLTRCVVVPIIRANRKENHFNWFQSNKGKFSNYMYQLLKNRSKLKAEFIQDLHNGKDFFVKKGLDDRIAIHYAIIGCGYAAAFGNLPKDFMDYLGTETVRIRDDYEKESAVSVFWDDVLALVSQGIIKNDCWVVDEGMVYVYFHSLYITWAEHYRRVRGVEPFKASAMRDYLKEEPGFVSLNYLKKIKNVGRRCVVYQLSECSYQLKELVELHQIPAVAGKSN